MGYAAIGTRVADQAVPLIVDPPENVGIKNQALTAIAALLIQARRTLDPFELINDSNLVIDVSVTTSAGLLPQDQHRGDPPRWQERNPGRFLGVFQRLSLDAERVGSLDRFGSAGCLELTEDVADMKFDGALGEF